MNQIGPDGLNGQGEHDHQGLSRRRLLRAAATAAPLIATLPSGAAQAAASAYHCIIQDRQSTQPPTGIVQPATAPGADGYVRVDGTQFTYVSTTGFNSLMIIQITGAPALYFASSGTIGGTAYNVGSEFIPSGTGSFAGLTWVPGPPTTGTSIKLMQYYRATSPTNVVDNPTGVTNCSAGNTGTICVFPRSQVGGPDGAGTLGANMGLTGSCLTSIAV